MSLPSTITSTTPVGGDLPSTLDNQIRALKLAFEDIMGIPDATVIAAALFEVVAGGLKTVRFQDAAGNPATAGYLQRNATNLAFYDGTASRNVIFDTATQTLTNKTLDTPVIGAATGTSLVLTGALTPGQAAGIVGTTTSNSVDAGSVGEFIEAVVDAEGGSSVALTTATTTNITSISLTAGDWDIYGVASFAFGATTSITQLTTTINTTSATLGASGDGRNTSFLTPAVVPGSSPTNSSMTLTLTPRRVSLAATTTVYLIARAVFTVSTCSGGGWISARRVR